MDQVLLFGVLITLFSLVTIKKLKEETRIQKIFHLGSLALGITFIILFILQFTTYVSYTS
ncbi:hypothetical protein [Aquibacillus kalidii]|uniref:hypothetical protein n=1 Tax=Aquibacillus kalidii TaxID=2762597 RepID=UPI001643FBC5|nr:hypothetical protein [Aquibacillus kalidii]